MKIKIVHALLAILVATCLVLLGGELIFKVPHHPIFKTNFDLQREYSQELENKLVDLLEPAVGVGNVRASVHAEITYQNITETTVNPYTFAKTEIHEKGPFLTEQSVSILINGKNKDQLPVYQRLVESAVGFNAKRGDLLAIEFLPFVKIPLWTLGLNPICLMRIAAVLILFIIIGCFWLTREFILASKNSFSTFCIPNESLWQKIEDISSYQLADLLKIRKPETVAFILHHLPQKKAAEIIDFLPADYMEKVVLHLSHIEKLKSQDKYLLLKEVEKDLQEIIQAFSYAQKEKPFCLKNFESLKNWTDSDLQSLLQYTSKKDLIKALQQSSLAVQQAFSKNIPPALWHELERQMGLNPCLKEESLKAQEKILNLAKCLKEKENAFY